jgi:hypothetical protein
MHAKHASHTTGCTVRCDTYIVQRAAPPWLLQLSVPTASRKGSSCGIFSILLSRLWVEDIQIDVVFALALFQHYTTSSMPIQWLAN